MSFISSLCCKNGQITYKALVITLMIICSTIAVLDRFTTNIWPIFLDHPKSPIFEDDWSASTFIIVCWICGRELIVSSAFIFLLQCKCAANWMFEHKPWWLQIDDIHHENQQLHYHIGWLCIGIPLLVHSWLVFLPLIQYPINSLTLYLSWMRPIDRETGFYVDNFKDHHVHLALNDLYALLIVTVCFMVLFPLSMSTRFRSKRYNLATYLHIIGAAIYGIELIRTPFTIHAWYVSAWCVWTGTFVSFRRKCIPQKVCSDSHSDGDICFRFFCGPIMTLYVVDRLCGIYLYRVRPETKVICKYNIDDQYVILFLHVPDLPPPQSPQSHCKSGEKATKYLGDVYWINCEHFMRRKCFAHPFTTFTNHSRELYGDIERCFLFSAAMRDTLSHRGHRFPIRTANKHRHVSYHEFAHKTNEKSPMPSQSASAPRPIPVPNANGPDFEMIRADTVQSTGRSASESVRKHQARSPEYGLRGTLSTPLQKQLRHHHRVTRSRSIPVVVQHDADHPDQRRKLTPNFANGSGPSSLESNSLKSSSNGSVSSLLEKNRLNMASMQKPEMVHLISSMSTPSTPTTTLSPLHSHDDEDRDDEKRNENRRERGNQLTTDTLPTVIDHSLRDHRTVDTADATSSEDSSAVTDQSGIPSDIDTLQLAAAALSASPRRREHDLIGVPPPSLAATEVTSTEPTPSITFGPSGSMITDLRDPTQLNPHRVRVPSSIMPKQTTLGMEENLNVIGIPEDEEVGPPATVSPFDDEMKRKRKHVANTSTTSIQFGTHEEVMQRRKMLDDDIWIDEERQREYGWNVGIIMKVHPENDGNFTQFIQQRLGTKESMEYRDDLMDEMDDDDSYEHPRFGDGHYRNTFMDGDGQRIQATQLCSYGPYRSAFGHIVEECLVNRSPVVLIGTGAGASFILDFLMYSRSMEMEAFPSRVDIHFSCRSIRLFQWITDIMCGPRIEKQRNLFINAHLTSHDAMVSGYDDSELNEEQRKRSAVIGRASFETVLRKCLVDTKVFFCGAPQIQKQLEKLCKELHFKLYSSHCFG